MKLPSIARLVFNRYFFQKLFGIILLIAIFYFLKQFIYLFLLTFLFSYLFLSLGEFIHLQVDKRVISQMDPSPFRKFLSTFTSTNSIVLFLYLLFVGLLIFAITDLIPKVIQELSDLSKSIPFLDQQIKMIQEKLVEVKNFKQDFKGTLDEIFKDSNFNIIKDSLAKIITAGRVIIELVISLILSYVFIVDRHKIQEYLKEVKKGNFGFLYNEYAVIFTKISNGFGLIFKAQSFISFVNTILTVISLYFISFINNKFPFPFIFTLAIIVFIFGMIPVLGMFLSSVPMIMIGYSFGGVTVVIEILAMVVVIHMIEAYYLNPRIVSNYAELPISLTFLILVISEQLFGFAGLLIGVPIFYIVMDFLKDFDQYIGKVRKAYVGISYLKDETKNNIVKEIRLSRSGKKGV